MHPHDFSDSSFFSINLRGFNTCKEGLILNSIWSFDLCFVQETLLSSASSIKHLSSRWPGPSFWSPAIGRRGGVAVLINDKFDGKVLNWRKDPCGRIISLLVDLFDLRINLISIYTQVNPTERKSFFDNLHEYFIPSHSIIVGGDFNCYDSDLDKFGGNVSLATYLSELKSLIFGVSFIVDLVN